MKEEETMDYQSMKRKELQALCKKHGVPANLSNREMADRLSSILKVNQKLTLRGESLLKNSSKKLNENNSKAKTKVVKKVRFSPENQTFFYEISGYKRGGRRRCTLKPVAKKQIQPAENDVFSPSPVGRKRARTDMKKQIPEVRIADECNVGELGHGNVIGGLISRQLRNREVVVGKSDGDSVISRKKATQRGSKMLKNKVPEENVIASKEAKLEKNSKTVGRITRSRARFESKDSGNAGVEGNFENEEPSKGVGRNVLMRRTAEADKDLQKKEEDVIDDECCKMLSKNSRKVESVNRITRVRAKPVVEVGSAEGKNELEILPEGPSRGLGKYNLRKKSVVPSKGKVENEELKVKKETRKRSRNANLEGISELEAILDTGKEFERVKNVFVPRGPSKRTRRNSVIFISTDTTNEDLESRKNIGQKESYNGKHIPRRSRRNVADIVGGKASAGSHLAAAEIGTKRTIKIKLSKGSGSVTEATFDNEVKNSPVHSLFESNDAMKEEVNKAPNQSVVQSTVLERSNAKFVGREEFSGNGARNSYEIISRYETSTDNAGKEICSQEKTGDNVTTNDIEPEEVFNNERASQVAGETIISEGIERNLSVYDNAILISVETDGKDAKKKETEVLEGYTQDAIWRENEFSVQNPNNVSKETKGRCMHELSDATGINTIIMKEMGTDSAHSTVNKGSFTYKLTSLKNPSDHEKEGSLVLVPIDSRKSLSTSKDKLLVHSDMQETFKAKVNENVDGLEVEVQEQPLLQLALQDLPDGIEGDVLDTNSTSSKVLSQQIGNFNSVNRTEEQVCDDIYSKEFPVDDSNAVRSLELVSEKIYEDADLDEEKHGSVDIIAKDVPFNEDYAASKGIDDKGSNGELDVEQCADVTQKENPNHLVKVELQDKSDNEVVGPLENCAAGTILTELISKETEVSNEKEVETMLRSAECIERVDNLTMKESKSVNRSSHTHGNEVGTLAQVSGNHLVEAEAMEAHDGSAQNIRIAVDQETHAVLMEKRESLEEAKNVETSEPVSPEIPRKTSGEEFEENNDSAPDVSNEVLRANGEDLEERSNEVVGFWPPADEEQVCADIYSKESPLDDSNAVRNFELISEKIYDDADLVGETNSSVDIITEDLPVHEDNAASEGINGNGSNEESDVKQCADVAKEENPNCNPKVELRDKSDHEVVAPQENGAVGTGLTGFISKKSEISNEKEVQTMLRSAECIEQVDNLMVKESKSVNRNSHTVGSDVSALAQVTSNHLVEEEAMEAQDVSVQNIRIAAEEEARTVAMEKSKSLEGTENVETSVPLSPEICRKTSRHEFAKISVSAPGFLNEVLPANGDDLKKRSNVVVGFVPATDGARFGDLNRYDKQNVLEQEITSFISDDLMSLSGRAAYKKKNARIIASDLNSNNYSSDAKKEDNEDTISQVTKKDSDDQLPEVKLCNADDSDNSVLLIYTSSNIGIAADATEVAVDGKVDSDNIESGNKWLKKMPTFPQTTQSERKRGEKNSSEGIFFVDTTLNKPEMGSANNAVDIDSTFKIDYYSTEKTTLTGLKDNDSLNHSTHGLNVEDNAGTANEQQDDQKDAVIDTGFTDGTVSSASNKFLFSKRRKSITEVADEGTRSDKVCSMVVKENIEELAAVSSSTPKMSADFPVFSPSVKYSKYESKSLELNIDFPQLTGWEMNMILGRRDHVDVDKSVGGILEGNLTTQDYQNAMQVKENLRTNELVDQLATEKHLDEQEHHTQQTVPDEPICGIEEPNWQNELSIISPEDFHYDIQKDECTVSPEKVTLKEDTTTKGSNIAYLDEVKAVYVSDDLKEAEHIAVDPAVFSCSGSEVNSVEKEVHTVATEKMNVQEVKNVGTVLPVTPLESCADCVNRREASHEISGTILQQLSRSGSGGKEKFCNEMVEHDVHSKDYSNDAGKEISDKDIGNSFTDMALLFHDNKAMMGNNDATDKFGLEHNVNDPQEVVKDQIIEGEAATNEAPFKDHIHCSSLNQPSCGSKGKRHVIVTEEADGFHHLDDKIVATSGFKKAVDFENSIVASTLIAETAVDCPAVSQLTATSNHEQLIAKFTGEQLSDQKKAEEVSELNSTPHSDLDEPSCKGSKGSVEQENMHAIIHGNPDNKKLKNENTNLETATDDAGKLELKLLSPQERSTEVKTTGNSLFAKKLNSSTRKQNHQSTLIQRTPRQLVNDMKESFPSTKKQKTGNFTAPKSLSKRRALEDLRK